MKLNKMKKEDLEVLSYTDLTEIILTENKKPMKTMDIFKKICQLLELSDDEYTNKIGDFYTSMTTDKRFVLLENATWDLKDKHKVNINLEEEDDDDDAYLEEDEIVEDSEIEEEADEDNSVDITDDEVDLDDDNDMEDLTIVTDEELEDDE